MTDALVGLVFLSGVVTLMHLPLLVIESGFGILDGHGGAYRKMVVVYVYWIIVNVYESL